MQTPPLLSSAAFFLTIALCVPTTAYAADTLLSTAQKLFAPVSAVPKKISDNTITAAKIELGKMLYFDPRLSSSGIISRNTCHNAGMGGDDGLPVAIGHNWQKGPIQASVEMNNTPENLVATLKSIPGYAKPFKKAFSKDDSITFDNVARAIEAFEATLITPDAPFDRYLKGNAKALTMQQKAGLEVYIDKGCVSCHAGVNLGGEAYFPFGLVKKSDSNVLPTKDRGRFEVTKTQEDDYVFRAAPLRNIAITAPYFHSGQIRDLREAVALMASSQLGTELSEKEIDDVTAFLGALTGKKPTVVYPELPPSTLKTPEFK